LRQGVKLVGVGLGGGVLLAVAAAAVLRSILPSFAPSAYDVWIYAAVVLLLTTVGAVALLIPARRASRADPIRALRAE
jgi:putative ABC transport system permease protein